MIVDAKRRASELAFKRGYDLKTSKDPYSVTGGAQNQSLPGPAVTFSQPPNFTFSFQGSPFAAAASPFPSAATASPFAAAASVSPFPSATAPVQQIPVQGTQVQPLTQLRSYDESQLLQGTSEQVIANFINIKAQDLSRSLSALYLPTATRPALQIHFLVYEDAIGADKIKHIGEAIKNTLEYCSSTNTPPHDFIIFISSSLTPPALRTIKDDFSEPAIAYVQLYYFHNLYPPDHTFTPAHELLTPEEKQNILRELNAKPSSFPRIYEGDPVIKYHGWRAGNIVRIRRFNPGLPSISDKSIHYAVVAPGDPPFRKEIAKLI